MFFVIGWILLKLAGTSYYSPAFPRGGSGGLFSVECFQITATSVSIAVEHKNIEDTSWTNVGTFGAITAAGVTTLDLTGLKEQLRFVYTITATNSYDGIHLNMLAPAWKP